MSFDPVTWNLRPPADPALQRVLLREFVARETPMTQKAQITCLLVALIGWHLDLMLPIFGAIVWFLAEAWVRHGLRQISAMLADPNAPIDATLIPAMRPYYVVAPSWAVIAWSGLWAPEMTLAHVVLVLASVSSIIITGSTTCFAAYPLRRSFVLWPLFMLPAVLAQTPAGAVFLSFGIVVVLTLSLDLGRQSVAHVVRAHEFEQERDRALSDQQQTICELEAAHGEAAVLASTDQVTHLPNRHAFIEHLDARTADPQQRPFTLLLMDLDYFKNINDTMGHHVGDAALAALAQWLPRFGAHLLEGPAQVGGTAAEGAPGARGGLFAARLGGDEFALVLDGPHDASRINLAFESWQQLLRQLPLAEGGTLSVSTTCGVAEFPRDGADRRRLLSAADMAMRSAKARSRGTLGLYQAEMADEFQRDTMISNLLLEAIEARQFQIFLQPQVLISDGRIVSAEALTRFTGPALSRISVQAVFDVAEERGLGTRLSEALLESTVAEVMALHRRIGQQLPVAINLSPSTLKHPEKLLAQLDAWLAQGLSPQQIKLEITENAISGRGLEHVQGTLKAISRMGFDLVLDDFGTGHSTLAHLRKLPIKELKIERQFVTHVCSERKDQAIIKSALTLCDHLGMDCVVEGIEDDAQVTQLRRLGVSLGQGYRWAKPMPIDQFEAAVRAQQPLRSAVAAMAGLHGPQPTLAAL